MEGTKLYQKNTKIDYHKPIKTAKSGTHRGVSDFVIQFSYYGRMNTANICILQNPARIHLNFFNKSLSKVLKLVVLQNALY